MKHSVYLGESRRIALANEHFEKMMFYLECDMNLLIYGVGSKRTLIQDFLANHVFASFPSILVRGYHSGLMPKAILTDIVDYIREVIDNKPVA